MMIDWEKLEVRKIEDPDTGNAIFTGFVTAMARTEVDRLLMRDPDGCGRIKAMIERNLRASIARLVYGEIADAWRRVSPYVTAAGVDGSMPEAAVEMCELIKRAEEGE